MIKKCVNCKFEFELEKFDLDFLAELNLPEPQLCPDCRAKRRLSFLNLDSLHKRRCDNCKVDTFSIYPQDAPFPVFCPSCWWTADWDARVYALDYNPDYNIFEQYKKLEQKVPHMALQIDWQHTENSKYINATGQVKDSYLAFNSANIDSVLYAFSVSDSYRCINCANTDNASESMHVFSSSNVNSCSFIENCENCVDVHYSDNMKNCEHCFACSHLSNKRYHIFNKEYSKEEYEKIVSELKDGSRQKHNLILKKHEEFKALFPTRYMNSKLADNVSGDDIFESKDVFNSFSIVGGEKVKHSQLLELPKVYFAMDYSLYGENAEYIYETLNSGSNISNVKFTMHSSYDLLDIEYSAYIYNSSYIFFSFALRNVKYAILNKEYNKEDWKELKKQIIKDMNERPFVSAGDSAVYRYGEFFPTELSSFDRKDTLASFYYPEGDTQDNKRAPNTKFEIKLSDLPDFTSEISDSIVGKSIECINSSGNSPHCKGAFKVTKNELEFLKENKLPFPELCIACRKRELMKNKRNWSLRDAVCACFGVSSRSGVYINKFSHGHDSSCKANFLSSKSGEDELYCGACYDSEFS